MPIASTHRQEYGLHSTLEAFIWCTILTVIRPGLGPPLQRAWGLESSSPGGWLEQRHGGRRQIQAPRAETED